VGTDNEEVQWALPRCRAKELEGLGGGKEERETTSEYWLHLTCRRLNLGSWEARRRWETAGKSGTSAKECPSHSHVAVRSSWGIRKMGGEERWRGSAMGAPPLPRKRAGGPGRWEGGERREAGVLGAEKEVGDGREVGNVGEGVQWALPRCRTKQLGDLEGGR
jgi:hypothetical protein